jgi:hypothetical protein
MIANLTNLVKNYFCGIVIDPESGSRVFWWQTIRSSASASHTFLAAMAGEETWLSLTIIALSRSRLLIDNSDH